MSLALPAGWAPAFRRRPMRTARSAARPHPPRLCGGRRRRHRLRPVRHRPRICRPRLRRRARRGGHPQHPARRRRGRKRLHPLRATAAISPARPRSASPPSRATRCPGLGETHVEMIDVPVRDAHGRARPSAEIAARMDDAIARRRGGAPPRPRPCRPRLQDRPDPALARRHRPPGRSAWRLRHLRRRRLPGADHQPRHRRLSGARGDRLRHRLQVHGRPAVQRLRPGAPPLPRAGAAARRRASPPSSAAANGRPAGPAPRSCRTSANPGLLLRLEASIFELERFQRLSLDEVTRVILCFHQAVREEIIERTPAHRVAPYPPGEKETADTHPIEMRTLSTLDLSEYGGGGATFEDSTRWHKAMLAHGVRLGQPVKCVKLDDGSWGATLRIGLSMPMVVERAGAGRTMALGGAGSASQRANGSAAQSGSAARARPRLRGADRLLDRRGSLLLRPAGRPQLTLRVRYITAARAAKSSSEPISSEKASRLSRT